MSHKKTLYIFILPYDRGLNFLWLSSYRQTQTETERQTDKGSHEHRRTHPTVQRSLYCIFWNLVSALPAHNSTYPKTTWKTVLWMAWVKCMCSWSIAVCNEIPMGRRECDRLKRQLNCQCGSTNWLGQRNLELTAFEAVSPCVMFQTELYLLHLKA